MGQGSRWPTGWTEIIAPRFEQSDSKLPPEPRIPWFPCRSLFMPWCGYQLWLGCTKLTWSQQPLWFNIWPCCLPAGYSASLWISEAPPVSLRTRSRQGRTHWFWVSSSSILVCEYLIGPFSLLLFIQDGWPLALVFHLRLLSVDHVLDVEVDWYGLADPNDFLLLCLLLLLLPLFSRRVGASRVFAESLEVEDVWVLPLLILVLLSVLLRLPFQIH